LMMNRMVFSRAAVAAIALLGVAALPAAAN
jgi:hypothetical protein